MADGHVQFIKNCISKPDLVGTFHKGERRSDQLRFLLSRNLLTHSVVVSKPGRRLSPAWLFFAHLAVRLSCLPCRIRAQPHTV